MSRLSILKKLLRILLILAGYQAVMVKKNNVVLKYFLSFEVPTHPLFHQGTAEPDPRIPLPSTTTTNRTPPPPTNTTKNYPTTQQGTAEVSKPANPSTNSIPPPQTQLRGLASASKPTASNTTRTLPPTTALQNVQMDVMVPASGRDDRLRTFATLLGQAIGDYKATSASLYFKISSFRLLVTRFTPEEKANSTNLQQDLASLTRLPLDNVIMVHAGQSNFSRAAAGNLLHDHACSEPRCLITRIDADMEVKSGFFHTAVRLVVQDLPAPALVGKEYNVWVSEINDARVKYGHNASTPVAYFPIVRSDFNPEGIRLAEKYLSRGKEATKEHLINGTLKPLSSHRGRWRPWGKGMYVIWGKLSNQVRFNTSRTMWGGEDDDLYSEALKCCRVKRKLDADLIHMWHPKSCVVGQDVGEAKYTSCIRVQAAEDGSWLGRKLLSEKYPGRYQEYDKIMQEEKKRQALAKEMALLAQNTSMRPLAAGEQATN